MLETCIFKQTSAKFLPTTNSSTYVLGRAILQNTVFNH